MPQNKSVEEVVAYLSHAIEYMVSNPEEGNPRTGIEKELTKAIQQERQTSQEREREYQELIEAVESKYEGETRHQTALRYIKQAEQLPLPAITNLIKTREI